MKRNIPLSELDDYLIHEDLEEHRAEINDEIRGLRDTLIHAYTRLKDVERRQSRFQRECSDELAQILKAREKRKAAKLKLKEKEQLKG